MEIKSIYVTFEQATALKEKGWNIITPKYYRAVNPLATKEDFNLQLVDNTLKENYNHQSYASLCLAPELKDVVNWLRTDHNIWIQPSFNQKMERYNASVFNIAENKYLFTVDGRNENRPEYGWETPDEATSDALNYVLKQLLP